MNRVLSFAYYVGLFATLIFLLFFDHHGIYRGWNWFIKIPIDVFLASIWPIYWIVVRWLL